MIRAILLAKGKLPLTSKWCILRNNNTLRALIKRRMDEEDLSMQALCNKAEVPYDAFRQYLKKYDYRKGLTQWQTLLVCRALGIEVKLDIQLKLPDNDLH